MTRAWISLFFLAACGDGATTGPDPLRVTFDPGGWGDGEAVITVTPNLFPSGIVAGAGGVLFVFGHADVGHGEDATSNGRHVVLKLGADGRADPSFGDGGVFVLPDQRGTLVALAESADGRVLLLGADRVWRLDAGGVLEGELAVLQADGAEVGAVAFDPREDGSILVVGQHFIGDGEWANFAAEVDAAGGVASEVVQAPSNDRWTGVLDDGERLIFGERLEGAATHPFIGHLDEDLTVDESFAPDGYARVAPIASYCRAPIRLAEGRFAAVGSEGEGSTFGWAVLVFTPGFDLDATFDGDGVVPVDGYVSGLAARPSGGVLAQVQELDVPPAAPERVLFLASDGSLDSTATGAVPSTGFGVVISGNEAIAAGFVWPSEVRLRRL